MSNFITDVEQQYEVYCKIAEDYGFIDFNAKKNGFRCTTKSNEFNAGWVAFTGAVSAMRDDKQSEINQLKEMNQRYIGKMQEQQDQIAELKTQLNNMEQCYIQLKQEHNELIAFNTEIDRKQKSAEKTTEKYKFKVSMIGNLLRDSTDQDMTLKAIQTVIDRVGEHG